MKDYNAEVNAIMRFLAWAHDEKGIELKDYDYDHPYQDEKLERILDEYIQQWRSMHPWE